MESSKDQKFLEPIWKRVAASIIMKDKVMTALTVMLGASVFSDVFDK